MVTTMGPRKMLEISLPSFTLVRLNYSVSVTMKTNLEGILRICTYYSIMSMMRIAIVSPYAGSIVSFRGSLIEALVKRGIEVYVLAPDYSLDVKDAVQNLGAQPVDYFLKRTSMNPFLERKALRSLKKVLCAVKPDVTLGYMHKGAMYSVLASKAIGVKKRFALIEGLGYAFTDLGEKSFRRSIARFLATQGYRFSLRYATKVFFLNNDDMVELTKLGAVNKHKAVVIGGIGVDLQNWQYCEPPLSPITFIMVGRLLKEKGVYEYIEAAQMVKQLYPEVRFLLVGGTDDNPGSVPDAYLRSMVSKGILEWPGKVDNVQDYLRESSVFILPSYREGVPRSTQEAMALGRPIITTNVAGCRETVEDGVNGFLVPPRNVNALVDAMTRLIENPQLITIMGKQSRRLAEERFDIRKQTEKLVSFLVDI